MTLEKIEIELIDGLEFSEEKHQQIRKWLQGYASKYGLEATREKVWEDSDWVFNQIF